MLRTILTIYIFSLSGLFCFGQTSWSEYFTGNKSESSRMIETTSDGGYITVGYTTSYGNGGADFYVIKINKYGYTEWKKTYGGAGDDIAYSVFETNGGNFIVSGSSNSFGGGDEDAYVIKLDKYGNIIWSKSYGGNGSDMIREAIITMDGGYIMVGYSSSSGGNGFFDAFVFKTDNNGNVQWEKKIGGASFDVGNSIKQTKEGDYIILGETFSYSNGESDFYLVKINSEGIVKWQKYFGGSLLDEGKFVEINKDGSYILIGDTESYGNGDSDIQVIKTDANGGLIWSKTYGGISKEVGKTIEQTVDDGYIICGNNRSKGAGGPDYWLIKTDSQGNIQWDKTYGNANHEHGYQAKQTKDNGYIITGHSVIKQETFEEILVIKTDSEGNINWNSKDAAISFSTEFLDNNCENENTNIIVQLNNYGNSAINDLSINVSIGGQKTSNFTETISGIIDARSGKKITLQNKLNTLGGGIYDVKLFSNQLNDIDITNDTANTILNIKPYASLNEVIPNINCGPGNVNLKASSKDSVYWFHSLTSSTVDGVGENFTTPYLSETKTYFAQAGKDCPSSRLPVEAKIIITEAPKVNASEICGSGFATLTATTGNIINWYTDTNSQNIIFTGKEFITPNLNSNSVFYVKTDDTCPSPYVAVEVIVHSLPKLNLGNDTVFTNENKISLNAGDGFSDYLWSDNSTNQYLDITSAGKYWVTIKDANGCIESDTILIDHALGINDKNEQGKTSIFPNPNNGIFELNVSDWKDSKLELIITNDLGQTIYSSELKSTEKDFFKKMDLSAFPKGLYFIKISSKEKNITQSLILK